MFAEFVDVFNRRHGPDSPWPEAVLEDWVVGSPLVKVGFRDGFGSETSPDA